ncbi:hypothetical protein Hte_001315 [Hypoxylon texense]
MGLLAKILLVGLLAMYHGLAMGAAVKVADNQESVQDLTLQVESAPLTTVGAVSESIVVSLGPPDRPFPTYSDATHRIRTTQGINLVGPDPSQPSALRPTRAGEDTSRPGSPTTSCGTSQTGESAAFLCPVSKVPDGPKGLGDYEDFSDAPQEGYDGTYLSPRDDYDGYGYGSGSGTTPVPNGGYGSPPPQTTDLPPGGYGNLPPPPMGVATVTDPVTVTVSLESGTTSVIQTTQTVVTVTVTSTPASQVPMQNVTLTVTESTPTSPLHPVVTGFGTSTATQPFITPQMPADDPLPSSAGVVYTTVTMSSSTATYTTTTHIPPKPVTDTNAAEPTVQLSYCLLFVAAFLAAVGPSVFSLVSALCLLIVSIDVVNAEENDTADVGGNNGSATGCETQCGLSEANSRGWCGRKVPQCTATA